MSLPRHPLRRPESWVERRSWSAPSCLPSSTPKRSSTGRRRFHVTRPVSPRCGTSIARSSSVDGAGAAPTYVIDYPVATQPLGYEAIRTWARDGRCQIGAHLHPWVKPPFDEARQRTEQLHVQSAAGAAAREVAGAVPARSVANTGVSPRAFKAGRYGISPDDGSRCSTSLAWWSTSSVNPCMDFTDDGGPDFSDFDALPVLDRRFARRCSEVPCTHWLCRSGPAGMAAGCAMPPASTAAAFRGPGILSRAARSTESCYRPKAIRSRR